MLLGEVHQGQRVIGVAHGPFKVTQRQPAHAAMVVLYELAIDFQAFLLAHAEVGAQSDGFADQEVEKSLVAARPNAVGPVFHLKLQDAQVHANLQHGSTVGALDDTDLHLARLVFPLAEDVVDILFTSRHGSRTALWEESSLTLYLLQRTLA